MIHAYTGVAQNKCRLLSYLGFLRLAIFLLRHLGLATGSFVVLEQLCIRGYNTKIGYKRQEGTMRAIAPGDKQLVTSEGKTPVGVVGVYEERKCYTRRGYKRI